MRLKPEVNQYFVKEHHAPCQVALERSNISTSTATSLPNGWAAYTVWQAGYAMDSFGGMFECCLSRVAYTVALD
jgi:hypothetical protein